MPPPELRMKAVVLVVLLLGTLAGVRPAAQAGAEDTGTGIGGGGEGDLERYLGEAEIASLTGNVSGAIRMLEEGMSRYPESPQLPRLLGDIYLDRELFSLARESFLQAEALQTSIDPEVEPEVELLDRLAYTAGKLNREQEAIDRFERIAELRPGRPGVTSNLAWLYFKTRQLDRGERVLLEAMERFGSNRDLAMTLATIYGESFRYEEAERFYREAIEETLQVRDYRFGAITAYNLSLLRQKFYRFPEAEEAAEMSLEMESRAPGHMALGELHRKRMDFPQAHREFLAALELDDTPLTRINLAVLYRQFGMLERALAFVDDAAASREMSWIYNYGTDTDSHRMSLHRTYEDIYRGLSEQERLLPEHAPSRRIASFARRIRFSLLSRYHAMLAGQAGERVGTAALESGNRLNGSWQLYRAYRRYPRVALPWLREARDRNAAFVPESEPFYLSEEGTLLGDPVLLREALARFDPVWERHLIAETIAELVPLLPGPEGKKEARLLLARLYRLNPGAFLRNGLGLPVVLETDLPAVEGVSPDRFRRDVAAALRTARFDIGPPDSTGGNRREALGYRYVLRLSPAGDGIAWSVREFEGGILRQGVLEPPAKGETVAFTRRLVEAIYRVDPSLPVTSETDFRRR